MEEENIKCNDEEKGTVVKVSPTEREDRIGLRKVTLTEIFDMFRTLFLGFIMIYMVFALTLKFINTWIHDPVLDAPFELMSLVLWIFVPIVVIFAILYYISIKYKIIVKKKNNGGLSGRERNRKEMS